MVGAEPETQARRGAPWWIAVGVCAAVVLLAALVLAQRRAVARFLINSQLRALGLEEVENTVERFDLAELNVRDLQIGSERDLVVERIEARYSLASLVAGRLEEIRIRGVRLRGAIGEAGVSFGALDPLLRTGADDARGSAPAATPARIAVLPAANIAIEDAEVLVETPRGPLAVSGEAHVKDAGADEIAAAATLAARHALFDGAARVSLRGTPAAFAGEVSLDLTARGAIAEGIELEPATFAFTAALEYAGDRLAVAIRPAPFALAVRRGGETVRCQGETPTLSLAWAPAAGGEASALRVISDGGLLRLPELGLEARGIALDAQLDPATGLPTGSLRIESLLDSGTPRRGPKLTLDGKLVSAGAAVAFDVAAASPGQKLAFTARGRHDTAAGRGEARVQLQPLVFEIGGLQPAQLSPLLGKSIESASGSVEARGEVAWGGAGLRGGADVVLRELSVSSQAGGFERLNAAVHVDGPWPLSTPPAQLVSMARVDFGLELTNGLVEFQLRPDDVLDLASAEWSLAGGTVRTRGEVALGAEVQELVLELADIDLGKLLVLVDLDGLSGSGRIDGVVPVSRRGPVVEIRGAKLRARDKGWIRYGANAGMAGVASQGQGLNVVLSALENFHYDELEARLDGDLSGPVNAAIHLSGANPDYLDNHPVELNLSVESHLVDLLRKATAVYRIPAEIERQIQEKSQRSR